MVGVFVGHPVDAVLDSPVAAGYRVVTVLGRPYDLHQLAVGDAAVEADVDDVAVVDHQVDVAAFLQLVRQSVGLFNVTFDLHIDTPHMGYGWCVGVACCVVHACVSWYLVGFQN